jgi:small subunit ribosomal protein S8
MTLNNSISDSIVRIKNGSTAKKQNIVLNKSKLCLTILKILRTEGYIRGFKVEKNFIIVMLKYFQDKPVIKDITFYSPLSSKSNISFKQLTELCENKKINGLKLNILSTSSGIFSDSTCLINNLGGKLLLNII